MVSDMVAAAFERAGANPMRSRRSAGSLADLFAAIGDLSRELSDELQIDDAAAIGRKAASVIEALVKISWDGDVTFWRYKPPPAANLRSIADRAHERRMKLLTYTRWSRPATPADLYIAAGEIVALLKECHRELDRTNLPEDRRRQLRQAVLRACIDAIAVAGIIGENRSV